jgi:hypothetical protein
MRRSLKLIAWIAVFLLVIDVSINSLYPPVTARGANLGELSRYFNYGRSVEEKLNQIIGPTDEKTPPLALAGWLDPELWKRQGLPTHKAAGEDLLAAIYGMSFSAQVGFALREIDPKIGVRSVAGPAAPPNSVLASYQLDRGRHEADVVMLGVLASTVKALRTMSGMTWQFEAPIPFTYPRYYVQDGKLEAITPEVMTLPQFRHARQDQQQWNAFLNQLRQNDLFFNSFLIKQNWLDHSATFRLLRRALAQRYQKAIEEKTHSSNGFNPDYEVPVLRAMVSDFAKTAKADGKFPIVLLFNDRGYNDHLFRSLQPTLEAESIPYVSTHSIAPVSDPTNFVKDGHFTKAVNHKLAEAVLKLINEHFDQNK